MRKTFKYIIAAASLFLSTAVFAQTRPSIMADGDTDPYAGLKVYKVSTMNPDGTATITLDTFVTGKAEGYTVSKPVNAVLVLDLSGSMGYKAKDVTTLDPEKGKVPGYYGYSNNNYLLWYNNGKWYRKSSNDSSTSYTSDAKNLSGFYISRIGMLKDACKVFVKMLYDDYVSSEGSNQHKVTIITYNDETSHTIVDGLVMNAQNYTSTVSTIEAMNPYSGTPADEGMKTAADVKFDDNSERVVLHVTDGKPTTSSWSSFQESKARSVVNSASTLKISKQASVYSISIVSFEGDSEKTKMDNYLGYSSSNYPNATAKNNSYQPGTKTSDKYYLTVTDPDTLRDTFKDIVGSAIRGAADCKNITAESVVLDVMSPDYQIPSNASNIKIYKVPYNDDKSTVANPDGFPDVSEEYRFGVTPIVEDRIYPDGSVCQALKITGFDYSTNWCGPQVVIDKNTGNVKSITPHGYKIHIVFDVEPTDKGEGGVTSTNNADSGIMVDGNVVKTYPRQVDKVMNSMDLKIVKTGLAAGATAIYSVSDGTNSWIVSLTSESDGAEAKATLRVPFHNDENNIISYTVSELDWNYTSSAATKSIAKPLYKTVTSVEELLHSSDPESLKDNVFTFDSTSSSSIGAKYRDESATPNNVFE